MAEFGENVRKAREKSGMTQQTLADRLYVTRQAVSRWENGSRYPDLMTAKSLAKALDTSLDELLRDDDMRIYPEVNPVLEYPLHKRVQTALFAAAFAINLILTMWYFFYHITDARSFATSEESALHIAYISIYVFFTAVLLYGVIRSVKDSVTPKTAAGIVIAIMSADLISHVFYHFINRSASTWINLLSDTLIYVVFIVSVLRFYNSKRLYRPIAIYIITGIFIFFNLSGYILNLISVIGTADLRKFLTNSTLMLVATLMIEILFIYMTAVLYRKRRLAKS